MKQPSELIFNDMVVNSLQIWDSYDDTYGYASQKKSKVKSITNIKDNWAYIVGMFDINNLNKLLSMVTTETREFILSERI